MNHAKRIVLEHAEKFNREVEIIFEKEIDDWLSQVIYFSQGDYLLYEVEVDGPITGKKVRDQEIMLEADLIEAIGKIYESD